MNFQCPFCSFILRGISEEILGRKVECPNCGGKSHIPRDPFDEGRVIGEYILKRKLGEGSIGSVFLAQQTSLDRTVAVKILSEDYANNEKGVANFLKEARAAAKLSHPNLVQAYGVGEEDGTCYMAMTYLKGESLKARIKREGQITVDEALHITQQVAEALHYAWEEVRIIHRDVKPENIMITEEGLVKLTDLGLAMRQQEWREDMEISGSPSYMSPEQFSGEKLDSRSDIYSLGITLYQMLSGQLPFDGSTLKTVARQHFYKDAPSLQKIDPMIPGKVVSLVRKMIAKHPDDRHADMEALLKDIWDIRQRTAPDRELVPDVHTISLKRLDYDLQKLSKEKKEQVRIATIEEKRKSGRLSLILLIMLPLIVLGVVVYASYITHQSRTFRKKEKIVENVSLIMNDDDISNSEKHAACQKAITDIGTPSSPGELYLRARLEIFSLELQNRVLLHRNEELRRSRSRESVLGNDRKQFEEKYRQKITDLESTREELEVGMSVFQDKLADSEAQRLAQLEELKVLQDKYRELENAFELAWKDEFRVRFFSYLRQARFREAGATLSRSLERRGDKHQDWFNEKAVQGERIERLYRAFSESENRFQGMNLLEGRIIRINDGQINLQTPEGDFISPSWRELSLVSLGRIAAVVVPQIPQDQLQAEIAILVGRIGDASKLLPEDEEMKMVCRAICQASIDNVRYLAEVDARKASARIDTLLREFEGIPEFEDTYRQDLLDLLGSLNQD